MTDEEIRAAIEKVDGLGGMTVNERLYVTGLADQYDNSLKHDKSKARRILEMLHVDKTSIDNIVEKTNDNKVPRQDNKNIIQRLLLFIINLYMIIEYWTLTTKAISGITTGRIADAWGDSIFMLLISVTCLIIMLTVNRQLNNKLFVLVLINSVLYFLMIFPANKIKLPVTTLFSILSIAVLIRQTIEIYRNKSKT